MNVIANAGPPSKPLLALQPSAGCDALPPWALDLDEDDDAGLGAALDDDAEWRAFLALALRAGCESLPAATGWRHPPALLTY